MASLPLSLSLSRSPSTLFTGDPPCHSFKNAVLLIRDQGDFNFLFAKDFTPFLISFYLIVYCYCCCWQRISDLVF